LPQWLAAPDYASLSLARIKAGRRCAWPDNKLVLLWVRIRLIIPRAARNCIGAKSPLTGGIAKSECGGFWGAELKRAGFDAIIIEGKAKKPVYLWVHDGEVSIRDASHLWGKDTLETEAAVRNELGDAKIHLAMIGAGGEHMVRYACIMEGCKDAGGRGGLGAVMGSKNLKAVAVRGHNLPAVANPDKVKEIRQRMVAIKHPLSIFGTGGPDMAFHESVGNLPVRNFQAGVFPDVAKINGGVIKDTMRLGMDGCFACPSAVKKFANLTNLLKSSPNTAARNMRPWQPSVPIAASMTLKLLLRRMSGVMLIHWIRFLAAQPLLSPWSASRRVISL